MKKIIGALTHLWKVDSARISGVLVALAAAGLIPGSSGKAIGVVLPLLFGQAVHSTVWSPEHHDAAVQQALLTPPPPVPPTA